MEAQKLIGNIDLGLITINMGLFTELITLIIKEPSRLSQLSRHEVVIKMIKSNNVDWVGLVKAGTLPFDALLYCQDSVRDGYKVVIVDPAPDMVGVENLTNGAKLILWLYLYIMIRGQAPSRIVMMEPVMPRFLVNAIHIPGTVTDIVKKISTTDISNLDISWIKKVPMTGFHESIRSRLLLGMPGHRWLNPFKILDYRGSDQQIRKAIQFVKEVLIEGGPYWDLFPSLKSTELSSKLPALSRNLMSLAVEAFTREELQRLVNLKVIFEVPDPAVSQHFDWKSWPVDIVMAEPVSKQINYTLKQHEFFQRHH